MHQTMEIYMARKKRVPSHYNPNSYRIFDNDVTDNSLGDSRMNKAHIERIKEPRPPHPREPERRNCPHPWHSRFLRNNVRLLNEPICLMATNETDCEQNDWWPSRTSKEPLNAPDVTKDTTQRVDYIDHKSAKGNTRHSSNPLIVPTKGILPVTTPKRKEDPGDILLEKISYSHDYNSRLDPSEPIRGKLHGSFVWDQILQDHTGKQIVETPWAKRDIVKAGVMVPVDTNKENEVHKDELKVEQRSNDQKIEQEHATYIPPIDGLPPP